ncbi:hypothetical protein DL764_004544 [Monosporascus ibericus]|uniref:laccase n=1 Tax=Monosporascus ibericus TaxID=155417 RepID=A0A4Q4TC55_9PEZI|nr:hypothetical protein DL764_004544 [Monosporascus ibericus]
MNRLLFLSTCLLAAGNASPFVSDIKPRDICDGNTATTRTEWCDFDINTDYYNTVPETGVTREYFLELQDVTVSPDGVSRSAIAVNGSIPGPTIFADWGDTVTVHVTNSLTTSGNGSSIHFHGIRQNFTNQNDGVVSITQCPTAVGDTTTYTWRATQYGSSWYHSHFALQAWEGAFGGIIINGPAASNYDEDLGMVFLNDWSHQTVDELYLSAETNGPPTLDNGLINGTNVYGSDDSDDQTGSRLELSVTEGTSYRLRLVNAAVDTHFRFSVDNHTLTVIGMDFVPIEPYTAESVNIGMGFEYTDSCDDEDSSNLIPIVSKTVGDDSNDILEIATVGAVGNLFKWFLNSTTMVVDWADPTLLQLSNNVTTFEDSDAVIELPNADEWVYLVIETTFAVPHPIHLHGFDFFVLAQGTGTFSSDSVTLNTDNPPRRDTAMLPASGYLVLAFETDNPGAWLMHCHIGWHTSEGFALQFVVRRDEILDLIDTTTLEDTCSAWSTYAEESSVEQDDSGV